MPHSEAVYQLVRQAMLAKKPIKAIYKNKSRLLCPHVLGRNRDGRLQILCYQFAGESSRGLDRANWRCIPLEGLTEVELVDLPWRSGGAHSNIQTCVEEIEIDTEDPTNSRTRRAARAGEA